MPHAFLSYTNEDFRVYNVVKHPDSRAVGIGPPRKSHPAVPGELAVQIEKEVYKFNKLLGLRSTTFAGGLSKYQQFKTIKGAGCCLDRGP